MPRIVCAASSYHARTHSRRYTQLCAFPPYEPLFSVGRYAVRRRRKFLAAFGCLRAGSALARCPAPCVASAICNAHPPQRMADALLAYAKPLGPLILIGIGMFAHIASQRRQIHADGVNLPAIRSIFVAGLYRVRCGSGFFSHRVTLAIPTPKRAATAANESPSCARTVKTLARKSDE